MHSSHHLRCLVVLAALLFILTSKTNAQWLEFEDASSTWLTTGTDTEEKDLVAADFNQDGLTDVVVVRKAPFSNQGPREDLLLMNTGTALEDQTAIYAPEFLTRLTDARDVVAADFDGDTWIDLVIASTFEDQPVYYANLGESGGNWLGFADQSVVRLPQPLNVSPLQFCALWAGDVSGDLSPDIYFSNYDPNGNSQDVLLINNGTGVFSDETNARLGDLRNSAFGTSAEIHDFDLDGDNDIIKISTLFSVPPFNQLGVFVLYNNGDGTFTNWQNLAAGEQPYMFTVGAIDDNAFQDIYIVDDQQDFYHLLNDSDPDQSVSYSTSNSTDPRTAAFGGNCKFADLDGDGDLDFGIADVDVDIPPCNSGASMRKFSLMQNDDGVLDPSYGSNVYPWNVSTYDFVFLDANGDFLMDFLLGVCEGYQLFLQVPECNSAFELIPAYQACENDIVTVDAGAGYDLYDWSTGESTQSIDIVSGGTYCVTVTDIDGCTYSSCTEVTFLAAPGVEIFGNPAFCAGGTTILEAVGGITYLWSDGSTASFVDVFFPGQYCVTVTDANGCTNSACVEVTEIPNPTPVIDYTSGLCPDGETTLLLHSDYSETIWSTGEVTETIIITEAGEYCVTVTDFDGCVGTGCITVEEEIPPTVELGDTLTHCAGTGVWLDATQGQLPLDYVYLWSHGEVGPMVMVSGTFSYCVTVTDLNGCSTEDCVFVIELPVDTPAIAGPTHVCRGDTIALAASPGFEAYNWSTGDTTTSVLIAEGGEYCVSALDSNGCSTEICVQITESEAVMPDFGFDTLAVCYGDTVQISPQLSYESYQWSNASTGSTLTTSFPGTYCVTVSDSLGCTGSICVVIIELPQNFLIIDAIVCHGDSINPDSLGAGVYTDMNGCDSIVEVGVMELPPIVLEKLVIVPDAGYGSGSISLEGMSVPGGINYLWTTGDTTAAIDGLFRGTYSVMMTDAFGCTAVFSFRVPLGMDRPDLDPGEVITVHPNPFRGSFTLYHPRSAGINGEIVIVDLTGRQVHRQFLNQGGSSDIQLEAPPGMYLGYLKSGYEVRDLIRLIQLD